MVYFKDVCLFIDTHAYFLDNDEFRQQKLAIKEVTFNGTLTVPNFRVLGILVSALRKRQTDRKTFSFINVGMKH